MNITQEELNEILKKHSDWLEGLECGERANLREVDLSGANLSGANLRVAHLYRVNLSGADLRRADLSGADLRRADLSGANLIKADLRRADLIKADLRRADLIKADLIKADLSGADLSGACLKKAYLYGAGLYGAYLYGVDLSGANLSGANLEYTDLSKAKNVPFIPMTCPESGSFIGWKKAGDKIIKLEILEDSRRSSSTGRKCRCDKAKVLAIENIDGTDSGLKEICSDYDSSFIYKIGEIVEEPNFCTDRFIECAPGIHFFINRGEAIEYV